MEAPAGSLRDECRWLPQVDEHMVADPARWIVLGIRHHLRGVGDVLIASLVDFPIQHSRQLSMAAMRSHLRSCARLEHSDTINSYKVCRDL